MRIGCMLAGSLASLLAACAPSTSTFARNLAFGEEVLATGLDFDERDSPGVTGIGIALPPDQSQDAAVLATRRKLVVPARIVAADHLLPETGFAALDDLMLATLLARLTETTNGVLVERTERRQGSAGPGCELFEVDGVMRDVVRTRVPPIARHLHAWVRVRRESAPVLLYFGWLAIPKEALARALAEITCPDGGLANAIVDRLAGVIVETDPPMED